MRIALLTEGGYPYARGEGGAWCDRLVRALPHHEFDVYALSGSSTVEEGGLVAPPRHVLRVRAARLWGDARSAAVTVPTRGRAAHRARRAAFRWHFGELAAALAAGCADPGGTSADSARTVARSTGAGAAARAERAEGRAAGLTAGLAAGPVTVPAPAAGEHRARFAAALHGLAETAAEHGGLPELLTGDDALTALESACRAPGGPPLPAGITVPELLTATALLERELRPLSLPWYGLGELGGADVCHAVSGGPATLPGLIAHRKYGTPLIVTEYTVRLREALLGHRAAGHTPAVRALLGAYHRLLAGEGYRTAALVTAGSSHVRRWQERCGAPRERVRTVYAGLDAARFARVGEAAEAEAAAPAASADPTVAWVGRPGPAKDLIALLHAFRAIHDEEPQARLRVFHLRTADTAATAYLGHCRTLAAQLFPDEAAHAHAAGENPVSFEEIGSPGAPELADAYAAGDVVVLSSTAEGFPLSVVEAMFCGRATVSTDVGAVREVIGGTGLLVPPRNPKALAEATLALLRGPERAARLGAAARERALALFTAEACVDAFRASYLDVVAHHPVAREPLLTARGAPRPFTAPAESWSPTRLAPSPRSGAHPR